MDGISVTYLEDPSSRPIQPRKVLPTKASPGYGVK